MLALTSPSSLVNTLFLNKHMRLQIQIRFCKRMQPTAQLSLPSNADFVYKRPSPAEVKSYLRRLRIYFAYQGHTKAKVSGHPSRYFSRRLERELLLCHTAFVFFMVD